MPHCFSWNCLEGRLNALIALGRKSDLARYKMSVGLFFWVASRKRPVLFLHNSLKKLVHISLTTGCAAVHRFSFTPKMKPTLIFALLLVLLLGALSAAKSAPTPTTSSLERRGKQ